MTSEPRSFHEPQKPWGPYSGMRWQDRGENPGGELLEHFNVLLAPLLSGKHLGGGSKPTNTESHLTQLLVGERGDNAVHCLIDKLVLLATTP